MQIKMKVRIELGLDSIGKLDLDIIWYLVFVHLNLNWNMHMGTSELDTAKATSGLSRQYLKQLKGIIKKFDIGSQMHPIHLQHQKRGANLMFGARALWFLELRELDPILQSFRLGSS